jgi:hypothetical protein
VYYARKPRERESLRGFGVLPVNGASSGGSGEQERTMNKLKMLVLTPLAAATVGTGALAAAPSASAQRPDPPSKYEDAPCYLHTNLGTIKYDHLSQITVIGSDNKEHKYFCFNGTWYPAKAVTASAATFVGSLATVLMRV